MHCICPLHRISSRVAHQYVAAAAYNGASPNEGTFGSGGVVFLYPYDLASNSSIKPLLDEPMAVGPSKPLAAMDFGRSVALTPDNELIVGAPGDNVAGTSTTGATTTLFGAGSVYVFTRNDDGEFEEMQRLESPTPAAYDRFGYAVASNGQGERT